MTIVAIPNIRDLGVVPDNNMEEPEYNAASEAFTGQLPGWGADNKAVAEAGRTNALHAADSADSASSSASTANGRAEAASASAITASTKAGEAAGAASSAAASLAAMQKLYLGNKAAHPAVDNQGAALQKGAWYTNSANSYWYWWNGTSWIVGVGDLNAVDWATQVINKPALVNSVNGRSGDVTGLVEAASGTFGAALMSAAPLGQWASFNSTGIAGSDWPSSQGTAWWNVFTFGSATRKTQRATQVYGGPEQGWTYERQLHDTTWSAWRRVFTDTSVIERVAVQAAVSGTVTCDPSLGSMHVFGMMGNMTINVVAPRDFGDQVTIRIYQSANFALSFGSNVVLPVGATLPTAASGEFLTVSLITDNNKTKWFLFIGGRHVA